MPLTTDDAPGRPLPRPAQAARRPGRVRRQPTTRSRSTRMDAVGFVVGNATQTAHFYQLALGMDARGLPRPGDRQPRPKSYVLRSGQRPVRLHRRRQRRTARCSTTTAEHGDGVVDLAIEVPDVDRCIEHAGAHGRDASSSSRTTRPTSTARSGRAAIATYGETRHTLVDRSALRRARTCPGYVARHERSTRREGTRSGSSRPSTTASATSSSAGWTSGSTFYNKVLGFTNMAEFVGDDIATDYSALMSKVVAQRQPPGEVPAQRAGGRARRSRRSTSTSSSTTAPAASTSRSPPTTSCASSTCCATTASSSSTPRTPTTTTPSCAPGSARCGCRSRSCKKRKILVDRDEDGYLLQIFTKPMRRPADGVLRVHRAARLARLRQGQLQGAVRGHRARAGARAATSETRRRARVRPTRDGAWTGASRPSVRRGRRGACRSSATTSWRAGAVGRWRERDSCPRHGRDRRRGRPPASSASRPTRPGTSLRPRPAPPAPGSTTALEDGVGCRGRVRGAVDVLSRAELRVEQRDDAGRRRRPTERRAVRRAPGEQPGRRPRSPLLEIGRHWRRIPRSATPATCCSGRPHGAHADAIIAIPPGHQPATSPRKSLAQKAAIVRALRGGRVHRRSRPTSTPATSG